MTQLDIRWIDGGREPTQPPDPRYPKGVDIRVSNDPLIPKCRTDLPYPAKRCGAYHISCSICGLHAVITTAGRVDDPRSVELLCLRQSGATRH